MQEKYELILHLFIKIGIVYLTCENGCGVSSNVQRLYRQHWRLYSPPSVDTFVPKLMMMM